MTDINKIGSADELAYKEEGPDAAEAALDEIDAPEAGARTIETVTAEIIMLKRGAEQIALRIAIELGRRLTEAKEMLPYGEWGAWVRDKVEFSQVTATRYMKLFEEYAAPQESLFGAETDFSTLKNLSVSKALALLAVPAGEREAFAAENHVDELSTRQMKDLMQRVKDAENAKEKAEAALAGERLEKEQLALARDDLAQRVKDLESRPVEVAVQEPDQKEIQARVDAAVAEASKEAKKTVKELKEKLKEATERAGNLVKEAAAREREAAEAATAIAERDRLREQLQTAEKKIAMSDAAVAAVNVHFETVQTEFGKLVNGLLRIADEATREKVRGAVLQLLDNFREEVAV